MTTPSQETSQVYSRMVTSVIRDKKVQEAFLQNPEVQNILKEIRRDSCASTLVTPTSGPLLLTLPENSESLSQQINKKLNKEGDKSEENLNFEELCREAGAKALEHIRKVFDKVKGFFDSLKNLSKGASEKTGKPNNLGEEHKEDEAMEEMFQRVIAIASFVLLFIVCKR